MGEVSSAIVEKRTQQWALDDLNKEIKQLTDRKASNDNIENDVLVDNKLNQTLDAALMNADRKVVRNLIEKVERAKQMMSKKNENVLTQVNKLLDELKRVQANKVYKDFYVMIDSRNLKDLNSFKDSEIDVLVEGVSNGSITTDGNDSFENLFLSMSDAHKNPEKFKHTDRKYFNKVYTAIQNNLGIDTEEGRAEKLADMKLDRIFWGESGSEWLKADELAELVGEYISDSPRDWGLLPVDWNFKEWVEASGFTYVDFAWRFNEVNNGRITGVGNKWLSEIEKLNLTWLTVDENNGVYEFILNENSTDILSILWLEWDDKKGLDILSVDELSREHFAETKKSWEAKLSGRIKEWNESVASDWWSWGVAYWNNMDSDLHDINNVAGDGKQFLQLNNGGEFTFNVENAKNFLKTIYEGDFNTYWSISRTGWVWVNISNWRAINSAVQILLNENGADPKLTIDGKWVHSKDKSRNAYYNAICKFQDDNDLKPKKRGHLDFDTLSCLIADPISVLNIWKIRGNKFVFNDGVELSDVNDGKNYIEYEGVKYVGWEEWLTNEHWYCTFDNCGDFYIWWFSNWDLHWYWVRFYSDWDKYEWNWENDDRGWQWTYTYANWDKFQWVCVSNGFDSWKFTLWGKEYQVVRDNNDLMRIESWHDNVGKFIDQNASGGPVIVEWSTSS